MHPQQRVIIWVALDSMGAAALERLLELAFTQSVQRLAHSSAAASCVVMIFVALLAVPPGIVVRKQLRHFTLDGTAHSAGSPSSATKLR